MQKLIRLAAIIVLFAACNSDNGNPSATNSNQSSDTALANLFTRYHDENLALFPVSATLEGENRYNDLLPVDFTDSYRDSVRKFFEKYVHELAAFDSAKLDYQD